MIYRTSWFSLLLKLKRKSRGMQFIRLGKTTDLNDLSAYPTTKAASRKKKLKINWKL